MVKNKTTLSLITGLLIAFSCFTRSVSAQEQSLSVYPPIIEVQTTAPSSPAVPIIIQNNSQEEVSLKIDLIPIKQSGATGRVTFVPELSDSGFYKYYKERTQILLDGKKISSITLDSLESKEIVLNINLNRGDPPGDFYYAITFVSSANGPSDTSTSRLPNGLGVNLLLSIGPKGPAGGGISKFKTNSFLTKGPVDFELKVHNSSKHLINPTGNVEIYNFLGSKVGKIELLPQYILSGGDRFLVDTNQATDQARLAFNDSDNTPKATWDEKFLLGWYKAKAIISLEENGRKIESVTYFFAFPLYFFIPVAVLIFITLGIYLRVKKKI